MCYLFYFSLIGFSNTPTPPTINFRSLLSVKSYEMYQQVGEPLPLGNPLGCEVVHVWR